MDDSTIVIKEESGELGRFLEQVLCLETECCDG
jgi:hypothetical protein